MEQHFLVNPERIRRILSHAAPTLRDHVVELGAGAGTVVRHLPPVGRLTLVERDPVLAAELSVRFPFAEVLEADAVPGIPELSGDVLLVNLPHGLVGDVLDRLSPGTFRSVLLAVREGQDLRRWQDRFEFVPVASLSPGDFRPPQPFPSTVLEVRDHRGDGVGDGPQVC